MSDAPYVSSGGVEFMRQLLRVIAVVALLAATAYWVNGLTVVGAAVTVPVAVAEGTAVSPADTGRVDVGVAGLPDGVSVWAAADSLSLTAGDSTAIEQMLTRGDDLLLGIAVALAAWLLYPVLGGLAQGRPFQRGAARRLAWLAVLIGALGVLAPLLPAVAAIAVQGRLGLDEPVTWIAQWSLAPLLLAGAVLVVAEAFRRGEQVSRDVEGLV